MVKVLEAVPNFSEGRDLAKVRALVDVIARTGVEVLDWSADPDHNRSVVTYVGDPERVASASVEAARFAAEHFDLRSHRGVHPRIGALDVLPFVPLRGMDMAEAVAVARTVGARLAGIGLPVYLYGAASDPPGRGLAELRRGGFEALVGGFPTGRSPDFRPHGTGAPHPTAGATCVGARRILLAWNVFVEGVTVEQARAVASTIRERDGGFSGLRALGLYLERGDRIQISMNLEDPARTSPLDVFRAIETWVGGRGGRVTGTEVIGMMPDTLVLPAARDRLDLLDLGPVRMLSSRVMEHVLARVREEAAGLRQVLEQAGSSVPGEVREAALRVVSSAEETEIPQRS